MNDLCVLFPSLIIAPVLEIDRLPKILMSGQSLDEELTYPRTRDGNNKGGEEDTDTIAYTIQRYQ